MTYRLAIFDFDGTLADTFPWFVGVLNGVADEFRFKRVAADEVEALRGRSAREIIRHLGVPMWKLPLIARRMRALSARDIDRVSLFVGVDRMLGGLSEAGVVLAVVSSNAEANVRRALGRHADLVDHYACGAALFGKAAKFRKVLAATGTLPDAAIAIGDEIRDHEAARAAKIAFGAVAWGFTTPTALSALAPDELFRAPAEIVDRLAPSRTHAPHARTEGANAT